MDVVEVIAGSVSAFALLWIACALERIAKSCRHSGPTTGREVGGSSEASSVSRGSVNIEEFVD